MLSRSRACPSVNLLPWCTGKMICGSRFAPRWMSPVRARPWRRRSATCRRPWRCSSSQRRRRRLRTACTLKLSSVLWRFGLGRLRRLSAKQAVRILRSQGGFEVVRQRGSHLTLQKVEAGRTRTVIVPNHDPLAIGTLRSIIRQSGMAREALGVTRRSCVASYLSFVHSTFPLPYNLPHD